MHRINFFYISFFLILFYTRLEAQTMSVGQYVDLYKNVAMREMITFKIPASITLAQGLLESGSGNSRLAVNGNNHFGIKCKKDWTGCTILEDDDALQECFRCYTNAEESYKDHSRFLTDNKRYAGLFALEITDYKGWAAGLLAAGYATNHKYTDLLISCIERNKLAQYDSLVIGGYNPFEQMPANIDIVNTKNLPVAIIQPNQTLEEIAARNDKTEKKLARYNDLDHHHIEPGDVIYLKPKKRKAGVATHTVKEGEDMWMISQIYAIRLQSLYKKNRMNEGSEPVPGSVLHLQRKAENMPDTIKAVKSNEINSEREADKENNLYHTVKQGETLYSISKIYGLTLEEIKELNNLNSNTLSVGQRLKIAGMKVSGEIPSQTRSHIVKEGETLYSISRIYKVKVEDIKKWNDLASDSLSIGQILVIR